MDSSTNALNWFEIATNDLDRAQKFYEAVFGIKMEPLDMDQLQMRMFPGEGANGKVGGAIVKSGMHKPSKAGRVFSAIG